MNPHTACTLCELEKHRLEVCLAERVASCFKGEAIADTARISSGFFEYVDGQEDQVIPLEWLECLQGLRNLVHPEPRSWQQSPVGGRWSRFSRKEEPLKAEANAMADGNHSVSNCRLIC